MTLLNNDIMLFSSCFPTNSLSSVLHFFCNLSCLCHSVWLRRVYFSISASKFMFEIFLLDNFATWCFACSTLILVFSKLTSLFETFLLLLSMTSIRTTIFYSLHCSQNSIKYLCLASPLHIFCVDRQINWSSSSYFLASYDSLICFRT